jgi:tRNA dimethylallyltransferase
MPGVIAIFGATASGKSATALEVAGRIGGEIVSCDALQLYDGLPILSNQPTPAERARVPHHLVAVWPLTDEGDVARYAALAHAAIDGILARGQVPVVVGGTGLYLRAALTRLSLPPQPDPAERDRITAEVDRDGAPASHARLAALDPDAAARIHPNDRRRLIRALELHAVGSSLAPATDELWSTGARHPTRVFGLAVDRAVLHERIARRVDAMLDAGALDEVRSALAAGEPSRTASYTVGLAELRAVADGSLDLATARRRMVERTRQYARRQEIWLRKVPGLVPVTSAAEIVATVPDR